MPDAPLTSAASPTVDMESAPTSPRNSAGSQHMSTSGSEGKLAGEQQGSSRKRSRSGERSQGDGSQKSEGSTFHSSSSGIRRHVLTVVQQPLGSAEFGSNVLSRLPLSPALIVQLECFDADNNSVDIDASLPFLFSHLTLLPPSEPQTDRHPEDALDLVHEPSANLAHRMLYGTLVSSPHELVLRPSPSEEPKRGIYFVFPDVSVRVRGTYRLGVGLMRIAAPIGDPSNPPTHESLSYTTTENFEITPVADYVAPGPTPLSGTLAEQGVQMFLGRHR